MIYENMMKAKYFEKKFIVEQKDGNGRIDQFLFNYFTKNNINEQTVGLVLSRSKIQNFLLNGNILVNDVLVKQSYVIKQNDLIFIKIPLEYGDKLKINPEKIYFEILYNDESICIINKPIGLVVHPAHGHNSQTLINGLIYLFPNLKKNTNLYRMGLVHRLDKDTSGILVITKNEAAQFNLINQFKDREVKKEYWAIVCGHLENESGEINNRIGRNPIDRKRMSVLLTDGKESLTNYKVIKYLKNCTLVKLTPHTGRTHQLRVHMNYLKHPIIGDSIYCKHGTNFHYLGLMLCAKKISFMHPDYNNEINFEVELPERFQIILQKGEC